MNQTDTEAETNLRIEVDKFTNLAKKAAKVVYKKDIEIQTNALLEAMHKMIDELLLAISIPSGYPDCTSAIVRAMSQKSGRVLIRKMHADENRMEQQQETIQKLIIEKNAIGIELYELKKEIRNAKKKS